MSNPTDSFVLLRRSSLAWILDRVRELDVDIPEDVAVDLLRFLPGLQIQHESDPTRLAGPLLSPETHLELLEGEIPKHAGQLAEIVVTVTHSMLRNEAAALGRILKGPADE